MPVCGPKLSLCGLILSVWGVIQLSIMGLLYWVHSVALAEDIPGLKDEYETLEDFYEEMDKGYTQVAYNCWATALVYLLTLLISGHQFWANCRVSASA